jgi:rSAM/selenodomain-associated transferase 2/rSAM/selenodomain-associated transferase 1
MDNGKLVIFTRFPEPGRAKTRLIPALGAEGAAQLQRAMTEHTVRQARKTDVEIEVRFAGGSHEQMREWLGDDLSYVEQGEGDLGEKMERTFADHFAAGTKRTVIVGSDCPANSAQNMRAAFKALETKDCVIGPATDGGYYLIGLRHSAPQLFKNVDWGGSQVLEQTMEAAANLSAQQLPMLNDVDLPCDIPPRISVIIPTLNEEQNLFRALEKVDEGFNIESIVVDGGSNDATTMIAQERNARVLACSSGRAAQQNVGAQKATGELLLFLHADTFLPDGWDWIIRETLADPAVALGAFTFKVSEPMRGLKFIEDTANWRSKLGSLPYGDQGLFMRRERFDQAGGFPDMPIMEDYAFVRKVRRFGKIITAPQPALTSGRRWQQHGVLKVTVVNKLMILGYHLGVSPTKLASFYRRA